MASSVKQNRSEMSLSARAYEEIRNRILMGEFPMGAAIPRRKVAEDLGMSVLPVAEALQRLEVEGLVETQARVGTRVRLPTPQDIRGIYIVREALESQAARLFAARASAADRDALSAAAEHLDALYFQQPKPGVKQTEHLFRIHEVHTAFHLRIAEATGTPALVEALQSHHLMVFLWLYEINFGNHSEPHPRWHVDLASVLSQRDPIRADEAMRAHVQEGLDDFLASMEPFLRWDEERLQSASEKRRLSVAKGARATLSK
jgi:DNA-binding GntR family transcriptional regulator